MMLKEGNGVDRISVEKLWRAFETRIISSFHEPCVLPPIAQRKQASLVAGLRNTCTQTPIVAPTPSLTTEANIASGEPVDLRAAKRTRLMLLRHAP